MTEWERGIQAFQRGALREAADRLHAAAEDHERTVTQSVRFQTLAYLGACLYALGRSAESIASFEQAIRLCPQRPCSAEVRINLANAYLAGGRPNDAQKILGEALEDYPGNLEAQMLLERLTQRDPDQPLTGGTLGESPERVRKYLQTLSFGTVAAGGWDPAQVRLALSQIERHLDFLVEQILSRDEIIQGLEAELAYIRHQLDTPLSVPEAGGEPVSPLEALLRQKPRPAS